MQIYGENQGTGYGVAGRANTGTGVFADTQSGTSILATAVGGTGVDASVGADGTGIKTKAPNSGTALSVTGMAKFSRSGVVTIAPGTSSKAVTPAGVNSNSMIIATAQQTASVSVKAAVPGSGSFMIYLTGNAPAAGLVRGRGARYGFALLCNPASAGRRSASGSLWGDGSACRSPKKLFDLSGSKVSAT